MTFVRSAFSLTADALRVATRLRCLSLLELSDNAPHNSSFRFPITRAPNGY